MAEQKIIRKLTPKQREALEKIAATAAELGISEAKLCERIGITGSALSQIRKGYYAGNWDNQFEKIYAYFENKAAASETYSEVEYAPTSISTLVYKTVRNTQLKGGFAFVTGDAGVGKTMALHKYIEDHPHDSVMITINPCTKSTKAVLKLLALNLGVPVTQSRDDLWMSIAAKLHDGMVVAVDEAQLLTYGSIETLRSFADFFAERRQTLGVVLVGNQGIREKIEGKSREQYRQVANRAKSCEKKVSGNDAGSQLNKTTTSEKSSNEPDSRHGFFSFVKKVGSAIVEDYTQTCERRNRE